MNQKKQIPAVFYSLIGLALLLQWFLLSFCFIDTLNFDYEKSNHFLRITSALLKNAIYWKPYTLFSLLLGIWIYPKNQFFDTLVETSQKTLLIVSFLLIILVSISLLTGSLIIDKPFFTSFDTSIILCLVYGIIVIILGLWIAKHNWLHEYHFHYRELKALFNYSLVLYLIWIIFKLLQVYTYISKGFFGNLMYMVDSLAVNILLVYIYLFVLISLENFRLGKKVLSIFKWLGQTRYIYVITLLIIFCYAIIRFA